MNAYEWLKLKYGEKIDEKEPIRLFRGKQLKKYLEGGSRKWGGCESIKKEKRDAVTEYLQALMDDFERVYGTAAPKVKVPYFGEDDFLEIILAIDEEFSPSAEIVIEYRRWDGMQGAIEGYAEREGLSIEEFLNRVDAVSLLDKRLTFINPYSSASGSARDLVDLLLHEYAHFHLGHRLPVITLDEEGDAERFAMTELKNWKHKIPKLKELLKS